MSEQRPEGSSPTYTRRAALGLGAVAVAGVTLGSSPAGALPTGPSTAGPSPAGPSTVEALRPEIAPRGAWGVDLPTTGTIVAEDDVRFLLVHHTASTNDYGPDDVIDQIQGFYRFHTGPEKRWPDVAYNFFVDRFGGIWEARQGSLAGPVRGDATGGSQGHALLCSLIGDHSQVPVSEAAQAALVSLLAWLAERHGLVTEPGATTEFVSRGSNRWPEGVVVTAATISGHRDMSETSCPGDFAYDLLADDLPRAVTDRRVQVAATVSTTTSEAEPQATLIAPSSTSHESDPTRSTAGGPGGPDDPGDDQAAPSSTVGDDAGGPLDNPVLPAAVLGGAAAVAAAAAAQRRRRQAGPTDV